MTSWTTDELNTFGVADEIGIEPLRRDGTLRNSVTIWIVRLGDALYVRSAYGRRAGWFRAAQMGHEGRLRAGSMEKDVRFVDADPKLNDAIDNAYRAKYRSHGASYVNMMIAAEARSATLKLIPK
jgi:hypothetical protein